jgi:hypothetical protein
MRVTWVSEQKGLKSWLTGDNRDEWLVQQLKEKRKCRILCVTITLGVIITIAAAVLVAYYFLKIHK